jgi:tyrosyl-tRNA synthetase
MLKVFSFKSLAEIDQLVAASSAEPHLRIGQRALAQEMTSLVHSEQNMQQAESAAALLFGNGDLSTIAESALVAALAEAGLVEVKLVAGELPVLPDLLVAAEIVKSKTEARRMIAEGAAWVNNQKWTDENAKIPLETLLFQRFLVLRRGRKNIAGIRVVG